MSKFNSSVADETKTINQENYPAYLMNSEDKLITQVLTSFFNESKFYGDNSEELVSTLKKVIKTNPEFVSKLAIFARRVFNMRSVSHVLVGYLANIPEGKPYVKKTVKSIVLRGDDATEILAFYLSTFGKPIPNSLRRALREVFSTFDAYTLAKYKGEGHSVKMRDILCLCRPTPKDENQSNLWKNLLEGTIQPAYTWETELSTKGNNKDVWEELIDSGKVGYMALLRNLRNILNCCPDNIQKVFDKLSDPDSVRASKQLPFRFLSAYKSIMNASCIVSGSQWQRYAILDVLERAAEISIENLPKIPGRTIIAIDTSGSMGCPISSDSDIKCSDIAALFGIIANKLCERSIVYSFDSNLHELFMLGSDKILNAALKYSCYGGCTNMQLPVAEMIENRIKADRIIYISDNMCNSAFNCDHSIYSYYSRSDTVQKIISIYRREINPDLWVHAIDLQGYGTQQFIGKNTNIIAGWSEKVFEFIMLAEQGQETLKQRIMNYTI